jgi:hypothetical protein
MMQVIPKLEYKPVQYGSSVHVRKYTRASLIHMHH